MYYGIWNVDKILREKYFPDVNPGIFLDVGAGHPETISNSFHFRLAGWTVYALEANPRLAKLHEEAGNFVVSGAVGSTNGVVQFDSYENDLGWGGNISSTACQKGPGLVLIETPLRTIDSILANEFKDLKQIDIVSMDIELYELEALRGWTTLPKYKPKVLVIEIQGLNDDNFHENGVIRIMDEYGYKIDHIESGLDFFFVPK